LQEANRRREAQRMRPKNKLDASEIPVVPEHVTSAALPAWIRAQLRALGDQNGEFVARHLAMVFEYLEDVPELAYKHARAAADRAGRVSVVREYAGLASYYAGRYAEAVRELRTYQRISGERHHSALLADALRGIGKPDEALELVAAAAGGELDPDEVLELGIVAAGARADLGDYAAALVELDRLRRRLVAAEMPPSGARQGVAAGRTAAGSAAGSAATGRTAQGQAAGQSQLAQALVSPGGLERIESARARIEALRDGAPPESQEFEEDE
jgi:tetratricopeptide (TPR) repeat protein